MSARVTDAELIAAARAGETGALVSLWSDHRDAALRLARTLTSVDEAEDVVGDAYAKVLEQLGRGAGPDEAFRPYLLTVVRTVVIDRHRRHGRVVPAADLGEVDADPVADVAEEVADADEARTAHQAWQTLPEDSRTLLWHLVVEKEEPARVAARLGISVGSLASRASRARERLRQAFLAQHAGAGGSAECREIRPLLGAHARGRLSDRDRRRVDDHLAGCERCRGALAAVREVDARLVMGVLVVICGGGVAARSYLASAPVAVAAAAGATAGAAAGTGQGGSGAGVGTGAGGLATGGGSAVAAVGLVAVGVAAAAIVAAAVLIPHGRSKALEPPPVMVSSPAAPVPTASASPAARTSAPVPTRSSSATSSTAPTTTTTPSVAPGPSRSSRPSASETVVPVPTASTSGPVDPGPTAAASPISTVSSIPTPTDTASATPSATPGPSSSTSSTSASPSATPDPTIPAGTAFEVAIAPAASETYSFTAVAGDGYVVIGVRYSDATGSWRRFDIDPPRAGVNGLHFPAGDLVIELVSQEGATAGVLDFTATADATGETLPSSGSRPIG